MRYELKLPAVPSLNHYYGNRNSAHGRQRYVTSDGKAFKREVVAMVMQQRAAYAINNRLHVSVTHFWKKDRRRRDLDNYWKPLLDALVQAGVMEDDSLIDKITAIRGVTMEDRPFCVVELEEVDQWGQPLQP